MYYCFVELDDKIHSALEPGQDSDKTIRNLSFLLRLKKFTEIRSFLMNNPAFKVDFIPVLMNYQKSYPKTELKIIKEFYSYSFLENIDFVDFSCMHVAQLQNNLWEIMLKNKLKDIKEISDLFLKYSIKIQIASTIHSSLLIKAIETLNFDDYENIVKKGDFQLHEGNYNVLVHLVELFPEHCLRIFKDLLIESYPQLYAEGMKNILLSVYMQKKFSSNEKLLLFKYLIRKLTDSDIRDLVFGVDEQGNHLLSAIVSIRDFNLFKETIKQIKSLTGLKITQIINKYHEDYENESLLNIIEYQNYNQIFMIKGINNSKLYSRFIPFNLIEVAISSNDAFIIKYLIHKKYNLSNKTRSGLSYFELFVFAIRNKYSKEQCFEILDTLCSLYHDSFIRESKYDSPALSFNNFYQNTFKKFINLKKLEPLNIITAKIQVSKDFSDKERVIRSLSILDDPESFMRIFPPFEIQMQLNSFCYFYLYSVFICIYKKSTKILETIIQYLPVKNMIQNMPKIFAENENFNLELLNNLILCFDDPHLVLTTMIEKLIEREKIIKQDFQKSFFNRLNFISMFSGMKPVESELVATLLFENFLEYDELSSSNFHYFLENIRLYSHVYNFRIVDPKGIIVSLILKSLNKMILNEFYLDIFLNALFELFRIDYSKCENILLNEVFQSRLNESLNEIIEEFLFASLKSFNTEQKLLKFEQNSDKIENSVVFSICSRYKNIKTTTIDLLVGLSKKSFELIWKKQMIDGIDMTSLILFMKQCTDKGVYLLLFEMILDSIVNSSKNPSARNKNIENLERYVFYFVDLYNMKITDKTIMEMIENYVDDKSCFTLNLLKTAAIISKIGTQLRFASVRRLSGMVNYMSYYILDFQRNKKILRESLKYLIPLLFKYTVRIKSFVRSYHPIIRVLIQLNHKDLLVESIVGCETDDMVFIIRELNSNDIYLKVLLFLSFNNIEGKLNSLNNNISINKRLTQLINLSNAYGRSWYKVSLKTKDLDENLITYYRSLMKDQISMKVKHSADYSKTLGFLGDKEVLNFLPQCKDLAIILETCCATIEGFEYSKKFNIYEDLQISEGYSSIFNCFLKIFEDNSSINTEFKLKSTTVVDICLKHHLLPLLLDLIPFLEFDKEKYSAEIFFEIFSMNESFSSKVVYLKRVKILRISPVKFFKMKFERKYISLNDLSFIEYLLKLFEELNDFVDSFICRVGNYEFMKNISRYSDIGICLYGTRLDLESFFRDFPKSRKNIQEYCKLTIRARKTDLSLFLLEKMTQDQCLDMISSNNCEILFDLAFYCLDLEAESIISAVGRDSIERFKSARMNGMSIFSTRLMKGKYSEIWEPLNDIIFDITNNFIESSFYIKKLLESKEFFIINFIFDFQNKEDSLEEIDERLIFEIPEGLKTPGLYLLTLELSQCLFMLKKIYKNVENCKNYLNLLSNEYETSTLLNITDLNNYESNKTKLSIKKYRKVLYYKLLEGNMNFARVDFSTYRNTKTILQFLALGKYSLFLYRFVNFRHTFKSFDELWEEFGESNYINIKKSTQIAYTLIVGGNVRQIVSENITKLKNGLVYDELLKIYRFFLKGLEIVNDYSTNLDSNLSINQDVLKDIFLIIDEISSICGSTCKNLKISISISEELKLLKTTIRDFDKIILRFCLIFCYDHCFKIHSKFSIKKFKINLNKVVQEIQENIPNLLNLSIYLKKHNNIIIFDRIVLPEILKLEAKQKKCEFSILDKNFIIKNMPNDSEKIVVIENYFKRGLNTSLADLIFSKCESDAVNKLDLDETLYGDMIHDLKEFKIENLIDLKLTDEIPINSKEPSTIYCTISKMVPYSGSSNNEPLKVSSLRLEIYNFTFLPYLFQRCRNLLSNKFPFSHKVCEMNYKKFINNIAMRVSDYSKKNINQVINNFFRSFEPVLLYINIASEFFNEEILGVYIDFHFDNRILKISKIGQIIVYSVPVIFEFSSQEREIYEICYPEEYFFYEDHMISFYSPKEIFYNELQIRNFDEKLAHNKSRFQFMFKINWDSIFKFFENYFELPFSRKTIKLLKKLYEDLDSLLMPNGLIHSAFTDNFWDDAILINSFTYASNSITLQIDEPKNEFFQFDSNSDSRNFSCVKIDETTIETDSITPDILTETTSLLINLRNGSWKIPESALPSLDSKRQVVWPSIGNILHPFPEILTISQKSEDKPNVLINLIDYSPKPFSYEDMRNPSISFKIEPYTSKLKNYFWYNFSMIKTELSNFIRKSANSKMTATKLNLNKENLKTSYCKKQKLIQWSPNFEINWKIFENENLEFDQGMNFAKNILNKFKYFLECIDEMFNFIGNLNGFSSFEGCLYIRPKKSLLRKLIARNLLKVFINVSNQESFYINKKGFLKLSLNPSKPFKEFEISKDLIIITTSDYILKSDLSKNLYKNVTFRNQDKSKICIDWIEKLELYSQIPLIETFVSLVSRNYFPDTPYQIEINLDSWKHRFKIKPRKDCSGLRLIFGRLFYNSINVMSFGEECLRVLSIFRPFNSVVIRRTIPNFFKYQEASSVNLVPVDELKSYSVRKLDARLVGIKYQNNSTDYLIINYFRNFPVYYRFIGRVIQPRLKYDSFCMTSIKKQFKPVVKPSMLKKLMKIHGLLSSKLVNSETQISCFIFTISEPKIKIITNKKQLVEYQLVPHENTTEWPIYSVFKLTFATKYIGKYYIYNKNLFLHSDFLISRVQAIDPLNSSFIVNRSNNFIVSFFDREFKAVELTLPRNFHNNLEFKLNCHEIKTIFSLEDGTKVDQILHYDKYHIEIKCTGKSFKSRVKFEILVDGIHIKNSPYTFTSEDHFDSRYALFLKKNQISEFMYGNDILQIDRKNIIQSVSENFPSGIKAKYKLYIHFKGEEGADAGGVSREFFDCLGREAIHPENKLFQECGEYFNINPSNNPKLMEKIGSLCANGIIYGFKIPIPLSNSLLKCIKGENPTESDIINDNPEFYNNINKILDMTEDELNDLELYFTVSNGKNDIDLIPGGYSIKINVANREKYIKSLIKYQQKTFQFKATKKFVEGFTYVAKYLNLFSTDEIRFIMSGLSEDDKKFVMESINADSGMKKIKKWLLLWLDQINMETFQKFLKFSTGSGLIPVDKRNWSINLFTGKADDSKLPTSATCAKIIYSPRYKTFEDFCRKFEYATENGNEIFGIV